MTETPADFIRNERKKAEDAIRQALQDFHNATGMQPKSITFESWATGTHSTGHARPIRILYVALSATT